MVPRYARRSARSTRQAASAGGLQSIYLAGLPWSPSSLSFQDGGAWRVLCVTRDDMLAKRCPSRRTSSSAVKSPELNALQGA